MTERAFAWAAGPSRALHETALNPIPAARAAASGKNKMRRRARPYGAWWHCPRVYYTRPAQTQVLGFGEEWGSLGPSYDDPGRWPATLPPLLRTVAAMWTDLAPTAVSEMVAAGTPVLKSIRT